MTKWVIPSDPEQTTYALVEDPFVILAGEGEMATLMRAHPWSQTSVGPVHQWPQSLRTVIRLMLNTQHPMYVFWGPSLICFYNDAYRASIGAERHPASLGQPGQEVWAEIWEVISPQIELVMSGKGATWYENQLVPITRNGQKEDVYWTYGYSPINENTSATGVGGVLVICTETTPYVLAEKRQSENVIARTSERDRLSMLFEQAPSFMAMLRGPEHRFELVNQAYLSLVGYRDVIGKTVAEGLPEAIEQGYLKLLDDVFQSGEAFTSRGARIALESALGGEINERFVDFIYQPIKNHSGEVTGIFVEGSDTTDRTLAEREVKATLTLLHTIINTTPSVIYAKDCQSRLKIANSATLALIGKSWAEVEGLTDYEFLTDPAQGKDIVANDQQVISSRKTAEVEEWVKTPDGSEHLFLSTKSPLIDEHGEVVGIIGVSVDITHRKKLEKELKTLNENLEAEVAQRTKERDRIWRYSPDLLIVLGVDGIIEACNPAWKDILGYAEEELLGHYFSEFLHPDDKAITYGIMERLRAEKIGQVENLYSHKDGSWRSISWTAAAESDVIYAIGRDVTYEKK